jgi:hypothetical protein
VADEEQEPEHPPDTVILSRKQILDLTMTVEGGLAALGAGAVIFLQSVPPLDGGLGVLGNLQWSLLLTAPVLLLGVITYLKPPPGMRALRRLLDQIMRHFRDLTLPDVAFISLLAGLGEEFFFRGALQTVAVGWLGPVGGVVAASVIFGAMHALNPAYFILATVMGLYLGTIYLMSGSLILVILVHALYDFGLLALIVKQQREKN